jgi:KilA-N domain.
MQQHFDLIPHAAEGSIIYQRPTDGYINATAMCKAAGKRWNDYSVLNTTKPFLEALSAETGIPVSGLAHSQKGGDVRLQGTWVHPQVAINLAQWCSPAFAVKVSQWILDWMQGKVQLSKVEIPYHLRRYVANRNNVPRGYFSILTQMTQELIAPMEMEGYTLPEHLLPDISDGRMFCQWLRDEHGVDTDSLPTYVHVYEDGRHVRAKAYPDTLLASWRKHFHEVWLPQRAIAYFTGRDNTALQYLPKLLPPVAA